MTSPAPQAVPGFETAETFRNQVEFNQFIRRLLPTLGMIFVVGTLMFAFILALARLGGVSWIIAVAASAAICGLLYLVKRRQFNATWTNATLELSPYGAVFNDPKVRVEMRWSQVQQVGPADIAAPLYVNIGNEGLTKLAYAAAAASAARKEEGLIGAATLTPASGVSMMMRAQMRQNDRVGDLDDAGQPLRAILLSHYDPNWRNGRIGQWVRAYRPDLFS